jgi:hypothetical protein
LILFCRKTRIVARANSRPTITFFLQLGYVGVIISEGRLHDQESQNSLLSGAFVPGDEERYLLCVQQMDQKR